MPLEVSPAPFPMQLPYAPKYIFETAAAQNGSVAVGHNGPTSVAASAIIPPNPGAVATPHRAIPALAEAGYTSTTIRPQSVIFGGQSVPHQQNMYGPPGTAGGSLYEGGGRPYVGGFGPRSAQMPSPNPAMQNGLPMPRMSEVLSTIHSEGWGSSSLPAPRPARISAGESVIAPRSHGQHYHAHDRSHSHGHNRSHHRRTSPSEIGHDEQYKGRYANDDDDSKSDGSYYAKPKHQRPRSRSGSVSSISASESVENRQYSHRRSGSLGHHSRPPRDCAREAQHGGHHRSPSLQPNATYSPNSPSPLSLATGPPPRPGHHERNQPGSPLSPGRPHRPGLQSNESYRSVNRDEPHHHGHREDKHKSAENDKSQTQRGRERSHNPESGESHQAKHSESRECTPRPHLVEHSKDIDARNDSHGAPEPKSKRDSPTEEKRERKTSKFPLSKQDTEKRERRDSKPPKEKPPQHVEEHHHPREPGDRHHRDRAASHRSHRDFRPGDRDYGSEGSEGDHDQGDRPHRPHHHRHHSATHLHPDDMAGPRRRASSHSHHQSPHHHHHHHHHEDTAYANSHRGGSPPPGAGNAYHPHALKDPYRRRAISMQYDSSPPHLAYGGGGPMSALGAPGVGDGTRPYNANLYQTPSVAGGSQGANVDLYDDGASVAGSGLTFMDGPIGGRTSQYGLPKYAHQMKPDYRRFMVQRGNADVFLD